MILFETLDFLYSNLISLYKNVMISNWGDMPMDEKTKQVQVRLTPELHSKLKGTLAFEERKLVDFFNEAALAYLTDQAKYEKCISEIIGGCNYGKGKKAGSIVRQPINK